jgi:hypothetical protein
MKKVNCGIRSFLASILVVALCIYPLLKPEITRAEGNTKPETMIVGQLTVIGNVTVNEKRAINGTTILNNSQIRVACSKGNKAIIDLFRLGRIELNPGTQFVVRFSKGLLNGNLIQGDIMVNAPVGVKVAINTPERVITAEGKDAVIPIKTQRGVRCNPMGSKTSSNSPTLRTTSLLLLLAGVGAATAGIVLAVTAGNDQAVLSQIRQ